MVEGNWGCLLVRRVFGRIENREMRVERRIQGVGQASAVDGEAYEVFPSRPNGPFAD